MKVKHAILIINFGLALALVAVNSSTFAETNTNTAEGDNTRPNACTEDQIEGAMRTSMGNAY
jgi:hypothetical protein